jgi:hypothetical protein
MILRSQLNKCDKHAQSLQEYLTEAASLWPLNEESFLRVYPIMKVWLDGLVFCFAKLQDAIGSR